MATSFRGVAFFIALPQGHKQDEPELKKAGVWSTICCRPKKFLHHVDHGTPVIRIIGPSVSKRYKMDCKNCGHTVDGAYCSQCGQSSKVGRINLANFLSEVSETLFKVDKGFFFTLRELSTQPGASIRAFLDGKRKTHFKPIAYALTLSTFYFLSTELTHQNTWLSDLVSGWFAGALEKDEKAELPSAVNWFMRNYAYATLCLLPIFSLASYIAFFKAGRNYLEHLVFNAYVSGHQALIYFTFAIMGAIVKGDVTRDFIVLISFVMAIVYAFWAFWQFFRQSSRVINLLSTSLTYVLYLFLSTGLLALSGLLV